MRTYSKLLLAALTATIALAIAASTATASRSLSVNPGGAISAVSENGAGADGLLTFAGLESKQRITSRVTLRGTLVRSIPKVVGAHVGHITECSPGEGKTEIGSVEIRCRLTLPWRIHFNGFRGTLPNITGVDLLFLRVGFLRSIRFGGVPIFACLFEGTVGVLTNAPTVTRATASETHRFTHLPQELDVGCEDRQVTFRGLFRISPTQRLTLL